MAADPARPAMVLLDRYAGAYLAFARTPDRVCLCGALAGEMLSLPPEIRARVDRFFRSHHAARTSGSRARPDDRCDYARRLCWFVHARGPPCDSRESSTADAPKLH